MDEFTRWKTAALAKADLSKKGSIDSAIECIVTYINSQPEYFTTSSCSGRIIICSDDPANVEKLASKDDSLRKVVKKKGCVWYLSSHVVIDSINAIDALQNVSGPSKLKFEPFVLHVQCATMDSAQLLHQSAVAAGFRNSGISFRKGGKKIIAAVRGTACLELPLTDSKGKRLTNDEYIDYVVNTANEKLEHNFSMIQLFETKLKHDVCHSHNGKAEVRAEKKDVYRKKGKTARDSKTSAANIDAPEIDSTFLFDGID